MTEAGGPAGELIIERFLPTADGARRDEARKNLKRFVGALLAISNRLVREGRDLDASPEDAGRRIIFVAGPPPTT